MNHHPTLFLGQAFDFTSINKFNVTVNECDGVDVVCDALVEQNGSLQFTVELLRGYEGELNPPTGEAAAPAVLLMLLVVVTAGMIISRGKMFDY